MRIMKLNLPFYNSRAFVFAIALLCSLCSGTNYAFSLYASALAKRLNLSATAINIVGSAGNWGMYFCGPPAGAVVDNFGPQIAAALFLGYHGLYRSYEDAKDAISSSSTLQLTIYAFLTGVGACLASGASINTCAKNFPSHRGTATGVTVMALGLGAFVYSAASRLFLSGDPGSLLNLLAISTAVVMLAGCLYVHVQDPKHFKDVSYSPLDGPSRFSLEAGNASSQSLESIANHDDLVQSQQHDIVHPDHMGSALMKPDFTILIVICGLLSGCGLMYINNVGHCVEALVHAQTGEDHLLIKKLQSTHVAIISLSGAFARVIAGTSSDILKSRFGIPRNTVLIAANVLALVAHCSGYLANDPNWLILVSILVGLAYGSLFGCCPSIISEYFGMTAFSQNWGWLTMGPGLFGQLFNLAYGSIFDSNSNGSLHECTGGRSCYASAFIITSLAAAISLCLNIWLHFRRIDKDAELTAFHQA